MTTWLQVCCGRADTPLRLWRSNAIVRPVILSVSRITHELDPRDMYASNEITRPTRHGAHKRAKLVVIRRTLHSSTFGGILGQCDLCSAFIVWLTLKALGCGSHSFTCKLHHTCLYFVNVHQAAQPLVVEADI